MTVRWFGWFVAILVVLWGSASAASAGVRALAPAPVGGPALVGSSVFWSDADTVFSAPLTGGDPLSVPASARTELVAGPGLVAARGGDGLSVSVGGGPFTRVRPDAGAPPLFPIVPSIQPSSEGLVVLEDDGAWLRRGGERLEVPLPPGADPGHVAVAGGLGVAPVPEGALIVFSLLSGVEEREISLGPFDGSNVTGLALSSSGSVAASVPVGDGTDALVYAGPGDSRVRVLARGLRFGRVALGDGRVAFVSGDSLSEGVRVLAVDMSGRTVFRGPPSVDVTSLSASGSAIAWATGSCALVATSSRFTLPVGPCSRTEAALARVRGGTRVACVNAPTRRCHVRSGRRTFYVPRGAARVVPARSVRVVDASPLGER